MTQIVEIIIYGDGAGGESSGCCLGTVFSCFFKLLAAFFGLVLLRGCIG